MLCKGAILVLKSKMTKTWKKFFKVKEKEIAT
jgi:hypothetical protein